MKIFFVGIHNKAGMAPLDSRTRSGKLIDRVIEELPGHNLVKTNLFDALGVLEDQKHTAAFKWAERVRYEPGDIIVGLGAITHPYFRGTGLKKYIALGHPSGVWSNVDKDKYVINAVKAIEFHLL